MLQSKVHSRCFVFFARGARDKESSEVRIKEGSNYGAKKGKRRKILLLSSFRICQPRPQFLSQADIRLLSVLRFHRYILHEDRCSLKWLLSKISFKR